MLSENEYAENPHSCTWFHNIDIHSNGMFKYIDFISPFPDQGYILVIVDTFTRWVELYHTTDATALSAAECLLRHFGCFGAPYQLRSDNGPHFIAEVIREFLHLIGVSHTLTLAYSNKENFIVERYNKETNRHLRALTFENLTLTGYKKSLWI